FAHSAAVGGDNGQATRHCFEDGVGNAFAMAVKHENIGVLQGFFHLLRRLLPCQTHMLLDAHIKRCEQHSRKLLACTDQFKAKLMPPLFEQVQRHQRILVPLAPDQRACGDDVDDRIFVARRSWREVIWINRRTDDVRFRTIQAKLRRFLANRFRNAVYGGGSGKGFAQAFSERTPLRTICGNLNLSSPAANRHRTIEEVKQRQMFDGGDIPLKMNDVRRFAYKREKLAKCRADKPVGGMFSCHTPRPNYLSWMRSEFAGEQIAKRQHSPFAAAPLQAYQPRIGYFRREFSGRCGEDGY